MPPFEDATDMPHTAVLWRVNGWDRFGEITVAAGVEIKCRWNPTTKIFSMRGGRGSSDSEKILIDAEVIVGEDVPVESVMFLGTLDDWTAADAGTADKRLHQVKTYKESSDIRGILKRRQLSLSRYSQTLPTVV